MLFGHPNAEKRLNSLERIAALRCRDRAARSRRADRRRLRPPQGRCPNPRLSPLRAPRVRLRQSFRTPPGVPSHDRLLRLVCRDLALSPAGSRRACRLRLPHRSRWPAYVFGNAPGRLGGSSCASSAGWRLPSYRRHALGRKLEGSIAPISVNVGDFFHSGSRPETNPQSEDPNPCAPPPSPRAGRRRTPTRTEGMEDFSN